MDNTSQETTQLTNATMRPKNEDLKFLHSRMVDGALQVTKLKRHSTNTEILETVTTMARVVHGLITSIISKVIATEPHFENFRPGQTGRQKHVDAR